MKETAKKVIVIDPGHSGEIEPGACADDVRESDLTLWISQELRASLLRRAPIGVDVWLTRETEIENDALAWRSEMANDLHADLFVSIHCNAAADPDATGAEVWYCSGSVTGRQIAQQLSPLTAVALGIRDRGAKAGRFSVLTQTNMPAVLIECGFISNDGDREKLQDQAKIIMLADNLAAGLLRCGV